MMKTKKSKLAKNKTKKRIHKGMTFTELMAEDKDAAMHLAEKGMFCCGCPMALTETLEQGAISHGLLPDELVAELNEKKKPKKSK